jgi:hypothetical protein
VTKYTVAIYHPEDSQGNVVSFGELPRPEALPKPGDLLKVEVPFRTMAGFTYNVGDVMLLLERTMDAPYGRLSSLGNWRVACRNLTSVWTNIEAMIAEGELSVLPSPF